MMVSPKNLEASTSTVPNITIPATPLITAALAYVRELSNSFTYNHVVRCMLFALHIGARHPAAFPSFDAELVALASILHDLGWETLSENASTTAAEQKPPNPLISGDKRFEVDGANAARAFVLKHAPSAAQDAWPTSRLQLLWDAIALHTSPSIALHKEPEVRLIALGPFLDFLGPDTPIPLPVTGLQDGEQIVLEREVWDAVVGKYGREGFRSGVKEMMCHFCRVKPHTTWDNFVEEFGELFVDGYDRAGKTIAPLLLGAKEAE
ncbi:uncharacterized protein EV422DRAFT_516430 [Fimicolochytrium jonesii]|uniref:uncharacterized protein n=1 Tax=Fimicolochytrium jonesii TaxID=1396493 RepID=UPI0022FEE34B|nr:uncharacterized protein EV422DRAFT_516430 [Fimicolochytrium jonesii]KAI8824856.1 hypothetical protein EV422DRAFT_516430 [Fimicolochytrium jonesii]